MNKKKDTGLAGVDAIFRPSPATAEKVEAGEATTAQKTISVSKKKVKNGKGDLKQTTLMLYENEIQWLDEKAIEVRKDGGKPMRKASLLRALIDLAIASPVDLKGAQSEAELIERFEEAIKNK